MADRPHARDELGQMKEEPLVDAEKKLIWWSLIAGVVLLVILLWVSSTFFPTH